MSATLWTAAPRRNRAAPTVAADGTARAAKRASAANAL